MTSVLATADDENWAGSRTLSILAVFVVVPVDRSDGGFSAEASAVLFTSLTPPSARLDSCSIGIFLYRIRVNHSSLPFWCLVLRGLDNEENVDTENEESNEEAEDRVLGSATLFLLSLIFSSIKFAIIANDDAIAFFATICGNGIRNRC